MKKFVFVLLAVVYSLTTSAQAKQEVISSAGGFNKDAGNTISISWTLGETIVPTFTSADGQLILTHGFQQKLIITTVDENLEEKVTVAVYPNPASEEVNIKFNSAVEKEITVQVLDEKGRMVLSDKIEPTLLEKTINLQSLTPGVYYFRLLKGKLINVYKVVKL
jgi:hypothetical protein